MPELPEVQSIVNALAPHLPGHTISAVSQSRLDIASLATFRRKGPGLSLAPLLTSRTITAVLRRAKRILLPLDNHAHLYFHLGMTGHLALSPPAPLPHTHLTLTLSPPSATLSLCHSVSLSLPPPSPLLLAFSDPRRFGKVVYLPPHLPTDDPGGDGLGPEPLTLAPADFHALLQRTRRPLKAALLDQRLLAGVGNIYADEALHAARLHPRRRAHTLAPAESADLLAALQRTLAAAIAAGGSTLRDYRNPTGTPGTYTHHHAVYGRTHLPCPTCQTPIRQTTLAQRSTHFCPTCQPYRRRS